MKQIKESSTNQANKKTIINRCPVSFTMEKIGGRWKPLIIYNLRNGKRRYNELKKSIPDISEKMLIQHLRELEEDNLISRKVLPVVPPHVEYDLTKPGKAMGPIFEQMVQWGLKYA